jgi:predicted secreted protein
MNKTRGIFLAVLFSLMLVAMSNGREAKAEPSTDGWAKTYGGSGSEEAYALVQTGDGGYAIAGATNSFGAGSSDFWLVKVDSSGNEQWNKTYGGTGYEIAYCMVQTSDGGYTLAGHTSSYGAGREDFWLVKADASGNMQWNKTYGGTDSDLAYAMVQTADGGYALAGSTNSQGTGSIDFWLVKTDSGGNMLWNKTYGTEGKQEVAYSVVQTSDGGYALLGNNEWVTYNFWLVKTDETGNKQWDKVYVGLYEDYPCSVVQTVDGGYALVGSEDCGSMNAYDFDFWLVKTDSSGNLAWDRTYGGKDEPNGENAYSLVQTGDGGYALAGYTLSFGAGRGDFWLVKADSDGNMLWNRTYGGTNEEIARDVVQTGDGGYAIAGYTKSFGAGDADFWLVKTDPEGIVPEFPLTAILPILFMLVTLIIILEAKHAKKYAQKRKT